jgi:SAM-dependent methyltransferase
VNSPGFDTTVPHPARVYDFLLGGKDNYLADREAAEQILKVAPEFADNARANRGFLARSVRYLARDRGIRQFLDIGTGIPAAGNTHQVAQAVAPESRIVYADNDPIVLAHARALLTSGDAGVVDYIDADLRDPEKILAGAAGLLDFTRPVALLLVAILHFIPDSDDPAGLVAAYRDALAPGSFLVLSHGTADFHPAEVTDTAAAVYRTGPAELALRPKAAIEAFFDGFTLEPPDVVQAPLWRPDTGGKPEPGELEKIGIYAGVASLREDG